MKKFSLDNPFNLGVAAAVVLVIGYNLIGAVIRYTKNHHQEAPLTLLDIEYTPTMPPKTVKDYAFTVHSFNKDNARPHEKKISDFKGKPLIVHFWATWCGPCVKELPDFSEFVKKHDVECIAVTHEENIDPDKINAFLKKNGITSLPYVIDTGAMSKGLGSSNLPTTVFINANGQEVGRILGMVDWADDAVTKLILDQLKK